MNEDPNATGGFASGTQGDEQAGSATGPESKGTDTSWQEVGRQFQSLGQSIAQAVRVGWENEDTQRQVNAMRQGLESMVTDISKAIEDSANTPQGQQIRQDATRAAEALRNAGEQTVQEVRPHLITALEQLNQELQKLKDRMEKKSEDQGKQE